MVLAEIPEPGDSRDFAKGFFSVFRGPFDEVPGKEPIDPLFEKKEKDLTDPFKRAPFQDPFAPEPFAPPVDRSEIPGEFAELLSPARPEEEIAGMFAKGRVFDVRSALRRKGQSSPELAPPSQAIWNLDDRCLYVYAPEKEVEAIEGILDLGLGEIERIRNAQGDGGVAGPPAECGYADCRRVKFCGFTAGSARGCLGWNGKKGSGRGSSRIGRNR